MIYFVMLVFTVQLKKLILTIAEILNMSSICVHKVQLGYYEMCCYAVANLKTLK